MIETAAAAPAGSAGFGYADSVDSSPRSRGGESWDEPSFPSAGGRLRLMCSYGGRIFPRPTDKSLCYLGGETRMVVVDRHSSLADVSARLSRTLLGGRPFTIKYQLPNEDLDSLISVATDEDLENMIEEYDRILNAASGGGSARSSRLRLFLFPSKPEMSPTSSIESLLDDSKSETWFVDALNSAMGSMGIDGIPRGLSSESASVNCLLGLEDDSSVHSRGGGAAITVSGGGGGAPHSERAEQHVLPCTDSSGKHASPMIDTTSSFGSASSVPSLSNLPPIRVRPEDRPSDPRTAGLEDQFTRVNLSSGAGTAGAGGGQGLDNDFKEPSYAPQLQPPQLISLSASSVSAVSALTISPTENPNRPFSSDDEKSDHGGIRKPLQQQAPKPTLIEAPIPDSASRTIYLNANSDPKREFPVSSDPSYRFPIPASDTAGYQLPPMQPEQFQEQQLHPQLHHHQQQQQFIPANPHYIHHPATGGVMSVPSYFHVPAHTIQQSPQAHAYDPQIPVYYYPVRANPPYNLAAVQPGLADPNSIPSAAKPAMPVPRVPVKSELPANLYRTAAAAPTPAPSLKPQLIHVAAADQAHPYAAGMGYHVVSQPHHLSQSPAPMANYGYEFAANLGHPQTYYSQGAPPPAVAPQCQPMSSATAANGK